MLTDGEIESLAIEVLSLVLEHTRLNQTSLFSDLQKGADGSLIPVYEASQADYGGFSFAYYVLPAIKKIVSDCDGLVDEWLSPLPEPDTQKMRDKAKEHQLELLRRMANVAALQLLVAFRQRLCETVEDAVEESLVISEGLLASLTVEHLKTSDVEVIIADATPAIEKAVENAARKRRDLLRTYLKLMPNILTERKRGGSRAKHRWTDSQYADLAKKYEELKEVWSDAKRIAKDAQRARSSKRSQQWRAEVLRAYPELPRDLLERFAHLRADDAKPSDIAILHAQRECGVTNPYSARDLRAKLRAWKLKSGQSGSAEIPKTRSLKSKD